MNRSVPHHRLKQNHRRRAIASAARAGAQGRNGHDQRPVLITGGAGFIGTNLAHRLLGSGQPVLLYDNLCRPGVEQNLSWLQSQHGDRLSFLRADVRNCADLNRAVRQAKTVFHLAAQVAVTTSLTDPAMDFEVNARGTLNLLEAARALTNPPPIVFTSTNKVYGDLNHFHLRVQGNRYQPLDPAIAANGFDETCPVHFRSPYGCSKGAAEQYVLDYARTFGLRTAVFRMSCIYGLHQFGNEDQGWVAHFLIRALADLPVTIFGNGRQVRDILFVEDLVEAFLLSQRNMDALAGQVFNIGGGPGNTTSLLELVNLIGELRGKSPELQFGAWRRADQQYYVSDTRKFTAATGWSPRVALRQGVARLMQWLQRTPGAIPTPGPFVRMPAPRRNGKLLPLSRVLVRVRSSSAGSTHSNSSVQDHKRNSKHEEREALA